MSAFSCLSHPPSILPHTHTHEQLPFPDKWLNQIPQNMISSIKLDTPTVLWQQVHSRDTFTSFDLVWLLHFSGIFKSILRKRKENGPAWCVTSCCCLSFKANDMRGSSCRWTGTLWQTQYNVGLNIILKMLFLSMYYIPLIRSSVKLSCWENMEMAEVRRTVFLLYDWF